MFRTLEDFLDVWERESELTQRILEGLTDASLKQAITPNDRTLGRIALHIVTTIPEMMSRTGLVFENFDENMSVPSTAKVISKLYSEVSDFMVESIKNQWTDDTLQEEREMYGERWTICATLFGLVSHQIHHRGQLTVLMRQAGLKVPGIYGPSREEWSTFGMEAPVI